MGVELFGAAGSGGGGLHFRNPPDEFTGANLAACRTARNTYFDTTDATAYQEFADDRFLAIILNPTNSTDNVFETYTGPATGGHDDSMWVDRTDAIVGRAGARGPQARMVLYAYINTATAPTVAPTGGTFVQSTGVKTVPTGYTVAPVSPPTGQETYRAEAIVNPAVDTDTVNLVWSIPALLPAYEAVTLAEEAAEEAEAARDLSQQYAGQAQDIPAGSPRGDLVATSPTLPTAATGTNSVIAFGATELWSLTTAGTAADYAAGEVASNERLYLPDIHPAGSNGMLVVVEVGGIEIAEVFISQGGIQGATGADRRHILPVSLTADALVRIGFWPRAGATASYIQITGNSDTLSADTVIKVYLAVVRGDSGGDSGGGGGGGGDATTFLALTDTPAAYGTAGQVSAVNTAEDGLEFVDQAVGGGTVSTDATIEGDGSAGDPLGLADGAVSTAKIAASAVHTGKINDDAVTADKIADNAVHHDSIADNAVRPDNIQANAVTESKIADGAVTVAKMDSGSAADGNVATADGSGGVVYEAPTGGGGTPLEWQDEGTDLAAVTSINLVGAGVVGTVVGGVLTITIAGGSAVPSTHSSQYLALKATDDPTAADFEGANGVAFAVGTHTAIAPSTPAGNVYLLLWRISTDPEPVFLDVNNSGFNQFGAVMKQVATIDLTNGDTGEVWVSENALAYQAASVEFR